MHQVEVICVSEKHSVYLIPLIFETVEYLDDTRARDKGSIRVKKHIRYILSKYSIILKNLGIDTQLFPNSRVKIKVSRPEKQMITILYYDYCT